MWVHYLVHVLWLRGSQMPRPATTHAKFEIFGQPRRGRTRKGTLRGSKMQNTQSLDALCPSLCMSCCSRGTSDHFLRVPATLRFLPDCAVGGLLKMRTTRDHKQNKTPNHLHLTQAGRSHQILMRRMPMEELPSAAYAASCYPSADINLQHRFSIYVIKFWRYSFYAR